MHTSPPFSTITPPPGTHAPPLQARLAAFQEALSELVMYKSKVDVALLQVRAGLKANSCASHTTAQ